VFIAVCDCTGHGVPGAFVSMIGASLLKEVIIEKGIEEPGEILSALSRGVKEIFTQEGQLEAQDGMDMTLCVFEKSKSDVSFQGIKFAGANNSILIVRKESEVDEIKADRKSIGGATEVDFEFATIEVNLSKGDSLYMYSDGYIDQFGGPKSKKFMKKKFKDLLVQIHQQPMAVQYVKIQEIMKDWIGKGEQIDDQLVIGIGI
jgi:serine phosphatase RsbU (regulator of sigma subunit)